MLLNRRTAVCVVLLVFVMDAVASAEDAKPRQIFLLIGQSNMAGRAAIEDVDKTPIAGAMLWNIGDKKWQPALPPYNLYSPSRKPVSMQRLNCGPSFVQAWKQLHPDVEVGIVCAARGGTRIGQWSRKQPDSFKLYHHAVEATKAALATGGELKGILWHQGEGDSGEGLLPKYPAKLKELVANLRQDLGIKNLPVVYSQLGQWKPNYSAFNEMILKQPGNIKNTACVKTDGLKNFDTAHFNSDAQRELGKRYATAMKQLTSKE